MAGTEENTNCNAMILLVDTITLYIFQIVESNAHGMTITKLLNPAISVKWTRNLFTLR